MFDNLLLALPKFPQFQAGDMPLCLCLKHACSSLFLATLPALFTSVLRWQPAKTVEPFNVHLFSINMGLASLIPPCYTLTSSAHSYHTLFGLSSLSPPTCCPQPLLTYCMQMRSKVCNEISAAPQSLRCCPPSTLLLPLFLCSAFATCKWLSAAILKCTTHPVCSTLCTLCSINKSLDIKVALKLGATRRNEQGGGGEEGRRSCSACWLKMSIDIESKTGGGGKKTLYIQVYSTFWARVARKS